MNVTRKEQRIIQRALNAWQASGELTPSDSQRLAQTMRVSPFDWRRLSRYAFWTALACVLISLGSLGNDSNLLIVFYVQIMPDDFVMQLHRF